MGQGTLAVCPASHALDSRTRSEFSFSHASTQQGVRGSQWPVCAGCYATGGPQRQILIGVFFLLAAENPAPTGTQCSSTYRQRPSKHDVWGFTMARGPLSQVGVAGASRGSVWTVFLSTTWPCVALAGTKPRGTPFLPLPPPTPRLVHACVARGNVGNVSGELGVRRPRQVGTAGSGEGRHHVCTVRPTPSQTLRFTPSFEALVRPFALTEAHPQRLVAHPEGGVVHCNSSAPSAGGAGGSRQEPPAVSDEWLSGE